MTTRCLCRKEQNEKEQLSVLILSYIFHTNYYIFSFFLTFFWGWMNCSEENSERQTGVNFNYFIHMYVVLLYNYYCGCCFH